MTTKTKKQINSLISQYLHTGKLILSQNLSKIDFGLYNQNIPTYTSLTDFLDEIHTSPTPYIKLHIKQTANNHTLNKLGILHKTYDSDGLYSYHILLNCSNCLNKQEQDQQFPLDKQLFELTELNLFVSIQHLSDLEELLDEAK